MTEVFPIIPGHIRLFWVVVPILIVIGLVFAYGIIGGDLRFVLTHDSRAGWISSLAIVLVVGAFGMLGYSLASSRNARFLIEPSGLRLQGDLYGRFLPKSHLQLDSARALDLEQEPAYAPVRRMMGTAIPGYRAGWFRLRNGERALLYVTDPTHIAYIPTTDGYALLLSVRDPAAFLQSLARIR